MAVQYIDPINGNDANDGSSFALRRKTPQAGAAGDEYRWIKTPDATSIGNVTWTTGSATLTLASALTANISNCDAAWTNSASVSGTTTTGQREGTACTVHTIAGAFTTGLVAYRALGASTDFSAYKQVSFWIKTTVAFASGDFQLKLCSDTVGATPVNTITIPAVPGTGTWQAVTVDTGGALGAAIQSVALYQAVDIGAVTINLDNILACKDSTSADSLTLRSLISKNTAAEPLVYAIRSINGTSVVIDPGLFTTTNKNYVGVTETVTTYKEEGFTVPVAATNTAGIYTIPQSGTNAATTTYSGGWDTTAMSSQTGRTWFDGQNGYGYLFNMTTKSFVAFSKLNGARVRSHLNENATNASPFLATNCEAASVFNLIRLVSASGPIIATNCYASGVNSGSTAAITATAANARNNVLRNCIVSGCSAVSAVGNLGDTTLYSCTFYASTAAFEGSSNVTAYGCTFSGNTTTVLQGTGGRLTLVNCPWADSTMLQASVTFSGQTVYCTNYNNTTDDHRQFTDGGGMTTSTVSGRLTWTLAPTSANRNTDYPLAMKVAAIRLQANTAFTARIWVTLSNTGLTAKLVAPGGQLSGIASDLTATAAASTSRQQLTITGTPTQTGMLEIYAQAYGGTAYTAAFDTMSFG